jgi:hypothetical protein
VSSSHGGDSRHRRSDAGWAPKPPRRTIPLDAELGKEPSHGLKLASTVVVGFRRHTCPLVRIAYGTWHRTKLPRTRTQQLLQRKPPGDNWIRLVPAAYGAWVAQPTEARTDYLATTAPSRLTVRPVAANHRILCQGRRRGQRGRENPTPCPENTLPVAGICCCRRHLDGQPNQPPNPRIPRPQPPRRSRRQRRAKRARPLGRSSRRVIP